MSFFNKILGGNMPLSVFETIGKNKQNFKLQNEFSYFQIREGMENVPMENDINDIMRTPFGSLVQSSLELNRDKVLTGLKNLISNSIRGALKSNQHEIANIAHSSNTKANQAVVNTFSKTFSENFLTSIKSLKVSDNLHNLHIRLVQLSGLTGESGKSIEELSKQVGLELELSSGFKVETFVDVNQTFSNVLTPVNVSRCSNLPIFEILFNEVFIQRFAITILYVWETILEKIMSTSKYDKLISLYAFGVGLADGLHQIKEQKPKLIEGLLDAGNSTKISDSTKIKDLKTIEKNIDQSKVMKGMTAMVSSAVTNAVNKNSADLLRSIAASNKISVGSAKGTSFTLSKITQSNTVSQETNANFVQQVTNKVINDIGSKLSESIDMAAKQSATDSKKLTSDEKAGSSIGGLVDSVANLAGKAIDGLAKTLSVSAGNSVQQDTSKDITQELKDMFKLDQSFKYEKNNDVKNSLENILSTENLAKCAADTKADNTIDLSSIDVSGPIVISELAQNNVVKDVMNCAFNQTVMNDISNKIMNDYNNIIKQMIENVDTKLDEQTKSNIQGDIYAAGVAGAAVLQAAGEASKDFGTGISTAAEGVGTGVSTGAPGIGTGVSTGAQGIGTGLSTAAEGVGKGIESAMMGFTLPLIVGAVILILLIIGYVIFKRMGGINKSDAGADE
jgi:hypothetical protein